MDEDVRALAVTPGQALGRRLDSALTELYGLRASAGREGSANVALLLPGGRAADCAPAPRVLDASAASATRADRRRGPIALADDAGVPASFRGRVIDDVDSGADPLTVAAGERVLAEGARGALWVRRDHDDGFVDRVAVAPPDLEGEVLRDAFRPGRFIGMLPLLNVARSLRPDSAVPATIQVDDPNLHRPTYGFMDFGGIRSLAAEVRMHVAVATIPLDTWYANRDAVAAFSGSASPLSLCVHGISHLRQELAQPVSDSLGVARLAQAVRRIERLERKTDLRVSRVMVAPHGACSREAVRRLVRVGFDALTHSSPRPWGVTEQDRRDVLLGARRVEVVDGLPIVLRRHLAQVDDLPFAAFLEQPIVVYGHHWDWPGGADEFGATAEAIDSLGAITWSRLESSVLHGTRVSREASTVRLRLATRAIELDIPDGVDSVIVDVERADERDVLFVNGSPVEAGKPLPVSPGRRVTAQLRAEDVVNLQSVAARRLSARAISRRALTESRDRLSPYVRRLGIGAPTAPGVGAGQATRR